MAKRPPPAGLSWRNSFNAKASLSPFSVAAVGGANPPDGRSLPMSPATPAVSDWVDAPDPTPLMKEASLPPRPMSPSDSYSYPKWEPSAAVNTTVPPAPAPVPRQSAVSPTGNRWGNAIATPLPTPDRYPAPVVAPPVLLQPDSHTSESHDPLLKKPETPALAPDTILPTDPVLGVGLDDELFHIPQEMSVKQLLLFFAGDLQRTRNYKTMPYYLIFLTFFTAILVTVHLSSVTYSEDFYFNQEAKRACRSDLLEDVMSRSELWSWIEGAAQSSWEHRPSGDTTCSTSFKYHVETDLDSSSGAAPSSVANATATNLQACCRSCLNLNDCWYWTYDEVLSICFFYSTASVARSVRASHVTLAERVSNVTGDLSNYGIPAFFPISLFALRQWRVPTQSCDFTHRKFSPIPKADRLAIEKMGGCLAPFSDGLTEEAFGPAEQFLPDSVIEDRGGNPSVGYDAARSYLSGRTYKMGDAYSQIIPYSLDYPSVLERLSELRDTKWIDGQARAVVLDVIFWNPTLDTYVHVRGFVEFFVNGAVLSSIRSIPFRIWSLHTAMGVLVFLSDVITCGSMLFFAYDTFAAKFQMRKFVWITAAPYLGVWEVFELSNLTILALAFYSRGLMWVAGQELLSGSFLKDTIASMSNCQDYCEERAFFESITRFSEDAYESLVWYAPAIVLAYMRLFKYLQHNIRLNALSETLKEAIRDLVGMLLIFLIVLVAYAIAGNLLFAHELTEFQTMFGTIVWLVRTLFSGEVVLWSEMALVVHPAIVGLYMMTWFLICWLVLLNMILAVIAGAFSVVQDNMNAKALKGRSLLTDVKNYMMKYIFCCSSVRRSIDAEGSKAFGEAWSSNFVTQRVDTMLCLKAYYEERYITEDRPIDLIQWDKLFITDKGLCFIVAWGRQRNTWHLLSDEALKHAFVDASQQTLTDAKTLRVGERSMERVLYSIDDMKRLLDRFSINTTKSTATLSSKLKEQSQQLAQVSNTSTATDQKVESLTQQAQTTVAKVTEQAAAVQSLATHQSDLLVATTDIAHNVESEYLAHYPKSAGAAAIPTSPRGVNPLLKQTPGIKRTASLRKAPDSPARHSDDDPLLSGDESANRRAKPRKKKG
ncbi:Polycystin-2 [Diplonema papillatum]|nr:Polycystin-2 [Diplonema papillatum]|eukprot:gene2908-4564_t